MQLRTPVWDVYSSTIVPCVHRYDVIGVSGDMDRLSLLQFIGVSCGGPMCTFGVQEGGDIGKLSLA